jgi:hypothetical protein
MMDRSITDFSNRRFDAGDKPDFSWFNQPRKPSEPGPKSFNQSPTWRPFRQKIQLEEGRILVLEYT